MTNLEYIRTCTTAELVDLLCTELKTDCSGCVAREYCYNGHTGFIDWLDEERRTEKMNHDYAHCADYETNKSRCPKSCFRGQLVKDLEKNQRPYTSWVHFAGTDECPLRSFTIRLNDGKEDRCD